MKGIIGTSAVTRIRILVNDVHAATEKWSQFLGQRPLIGPVDAGSGPEMAVVYQGVPAPEAEIRVSLFQVGAANYIELMEPNDRPSVWRDALNRTGEGLHSVSFEVDDLSEAIARCESFGAATLQTGIFKSGDGRYAYLDLTDDLKTVIELEQLDVPFTVLLSAVMRDELASESDPDGS